VSHCNGKRFKNDYWGESLCVVAVMTKLETQTWLAVTLGYPLGSPMTVFCWERSHDYLLSIWQQQKLQNKQIKVSELRHCNMLGYMKWMRMFWNYKGKFFPLSEIHMKKKSKGHLETEGKRNYKTSSLGWEQE
jgi:hypothetical protein